jgi:16S rRNA C967 or C1407 C5-methylase (RsmB/RsmF family)
MLLPDDFIRYTREVMGDERFQQYLKSFDEEVPISIRLNPAKTQGLTITEGAQPVPWCQDGYYLPRRPQFTMDPLLHAGCYYVQEAASMFLDEILRQHLPSNLSSRTSDISPQTSALRHQPSDISPQTALDLCAAPGGKSTLLRSALPKDCVLYSNEPIRNRASILLENVTKWGYKSHIVTCNYPKDYRASKLRFDVILCDVPCSGEGMFRRDEATIREWSLQNVEKCWQLQREIVSDAWTCLNDGGLLIYSTCTFNTKENEENIRWMLNEFEAEVLPVEVKPEWHITSSLLKDFDKPVYRFIPGISRSEGLFVAVLRKKGEASNTPSKETKSLLRANSKFTPGKLQVYSGQTQTPSEDTPRVELTYPQAIAYLRGEALVLPPDTPRGIVEVTFMGHPLGPAKNIGTRANNLYPKEWRIKTTHIPTDYEAILRHT